MKPLSDPLNSLHSLVVCLWSPTYRRWSAYGRLLIAYKRFGFGITDVVPVIFYDQTYLNYGWAGSKMKNTI